MRRTDTNYEVSEERLRELLKHKFETDTLDFKEFVPFSRPEGRVKLAKDVLAMANTQGGHIIIGVDKEYRQKGIAEGDAKSFRDGSEMTKQLRTWCGDLVIVHSAVHRITNDNGREVDFAILFVPQCSSIQSTHQGGDYRDQNGKEKMEFAVGVQFIRKSSQSVQAKGEHEVREVRKGKRPAKPVRPGADIKNPYDFIRVPSDRMFKGRDEEMRQLENNIHSGTHTAVFGLQRMGKTSLVQHLIDDILLKKSSKRGTIIRVKIDLQEKKSARCIDFFNLLMQELYTHASKNEPYEARKKVEAAYNQYQVGMKTYDPNTDHYFFQDLANALHEILTALGKKVILFIDEFGEWCKVVDDNEKANRRNERAGISLRATDRLVDLEFMKFFSSILRNERFKDQLVCIVAVKPYMVDYDVKRKLYLFRLLSNITLYYLDRTAAGSLIRDPLRGQVETSEAAVDYLYQRTFGHPYLIQLILNRVVNRIRGKKAAIDLSDIQTEEETLVQDGSSVDTHFAVLMSDYS